MTPPGAVLWDLDGTLADTAEDIALTVNDMLTAMALPALPTPGIRGMIGSGAGALVDRAVRAAGGEPSPEHLRCFMAIYRAQPRRVAVLYPGIAALLERVTAPQAIVTNKPERIARDLLTELGVAHHFRAVVGGDTLAVRKPDAAPVRAALAALDERGGVLVGDGTHDVGAARAAGLDSIGVTWGIGSPVGATEVARDVTALCEALAGRGLCRYR